MWFLPRRIHPGNALGHEPTNSRAECRGDQVLGSLAAHACISLRSLDHPTGIETRRQISKLMELSLIEVTYPPATGSPPHLHANGVMAFVVSGTIVSKVGDGAEQTFHAGDAWWGPPGAIHRVSRNASSTEPATLLAIYVAPKNATADDLMKPI
jgi:quercetin dioxygenase-like cupin family protein